MFIFSPNKLFLWEDDFVSVKVQFIPGKRFELGLTGIYVLSKLFSISEKEQGSLFWGEDLGIIF